MKLAPQSSECQILQEKKVSIKESGLIAYFESLGHEVMLTLISLTKSDRRSGLVFNEN